MAQRAIYPAHVHPKSALIMRLRRQRSIRWPFDWTRSRICHVREVLQPPDHAHRQITPHLYLAGEPHVGLLIRDPAQSLFLGRRLRTGITIDDLNPASRTARIAAAAVQNVDSGILDAQDETPAFITGCLPDAFHDHVWQHVELVPFTFISQPDGPGSSRGRPTVILDHAHPLYRVPGFPGDNDDPPSAAASLVGASPPRGESAGGRYPCARIF